MSAIDYSAVKRYDVALHRLWTVYQDRMTQAVQIDADPDEWLPRVRELMDALVNIESNAHMMYDSIRHVILATRPPSSN